ncbi:MAG: GNAT family N-acetyltransferase, partial [Eubacterium sp.]|nr:GNAT family N-acetyltransferase [Eubacterium sp.]
QHLGKQMMNKLFEISKERKNSKIMLDVVKGNLPAERLYQKMGFDYIGEKTEYIERVGNVDFNIYEYNI